MRRDEQEYIDYMGGWNDAFQILVLIEKGFTLPEVKKHYGDSEHWDKQPAYKHLKRFIKLIRKEKKDAARNDDRKTDS